MAGKPLTTERHPKHQGHGVVQDTPEKTRVTRQSSLSSLLACAHTLADISAKAIRPHFRKAILIDDKGGAAGFDPVTIADRAAERAIARHLAAAFPDHGIIGEEYGIVRPGARYRWVLDPIDGTRAFIMGLPTWGTLIGLMDGPDLILGVMNQPFTGERFWSSASAAHLRGADGKTRRIKTRACPSLGQAMISTTHPDLFPSAHQRKVHARLKAATRMTRYGADCYAFCMLAAGHIDIVFEADLKPYDIAALIPIIERAGGRVTTWDGGSPTSGGNILACGDPNLHAQALALIAAA